MLTPITKQGDEHIYILFQIGIIDWVSVCYMCTYRFVWMLIGSESTYGDALSILNEVHVIGNLADGDKVLQKKSYQGIFRCRAGVGGQGSHEAMESPQALIAPLKRGSGELR